MAHGLHSQLIDCLIDPATGSDLDLKITKQENGRIIDGQLISRASGAVFPIVRGIPRFVDHTASNEESFGYQWHRWPTVQYEPYNKGKPMEGHTRGMWEKITAQSGTLDGQVVGDFGCGAGRFVEVARSKGAKVIALDLSDSVEVAGAQFANDPGVLVVQGSVLNPPIRPASLDGAFSIGVLHHTPAPRTGLLNMAGCVKPGGWLSISVYGKGGYYDFPVVNLYRRLFKTLWPVFGPRAPLVYSYTAVGLAWPVRRLRSVRRVIKVALPSVTLPDWDWSVLDTFDSVTPTHQSAHESYEVFQWFKDANLCQIEPSNWGFTAYHAQVPAARA